MSSQSKLALVMSDSALSDLSAMGEIFHLEPEQVLFQHHDRSEYLYLVLEGRVFSSGAASKPIRWIGAGDLIGVMDFLLAQDRSEMAWAGPTGCRLWRLHASQFVTLSTHADSELLSDLLVALNWHHQAKIINTPDSTISAKDLAKNHCDHWQPSIIEAAAYLKGRDEWETAIAIWYFIQRMPYRIGLWNMKASETLQLGYGMCTTKANLHLALLRANGIESGIGQVLVPSDFVKSLLPDGYRLSVRSEIKHFFAAMKIEGRWYPTDASFTDESLAIMTTTCPSAGKILGQVQERNRPFSAASIALGPDPFDFNLMPDFRAVINKKPFYGPDNIDAMNLNLDRMQGPVHAYRTWTEQHNQPLPILEPVGMKRMVE